MKIRQTIEVKCVKGREELVDERWTRIKYSSAGASVVNSAGGYRITSAPANVNSFLPALPAMKLKRLQPSKLGNRESFDLTSLAASIAIILNCFESTAYSPNPPPNQRPWPPRLSRLKLPSTTARNMETISVFQSARSSP